MKRCDSCGAPVKGSECAYCGTSYADECSPERPSERIFVDSFSTFDVSQLNRRAGEVIRARSPGVMWSFTRRKLAHTIGFEVTEA